MPRAYLEGGPCDTHRRIITTEEADNGWLLCKGHRYNFGNYGNRPDGDIIAKDAGVYTPPGDGSGDGGTVPKAAHLHHGYADLRRSINHNMPTALHNSVRSLKAGLRTIERARKVRL